MFKIAVSITFLVLFVFFYLTYFYSLKFINMYEMMIGFLVLIIFVLSSQFADEYRIKETLTMEEFKNFVTSANYFFYFCTSLFFIFFLFYLILKPLLCKLSWNYNVIKIFFGLSFTGVFVYISILYFILFYPLLEKLRE